MATSTGIKCKLVSLFILRMSREGYGGQTIQEGGCQAVAERAEAQSFVRKVRVYTIEMLNFVCQLIKTELSSRTVLTLPRQRP